MKLYSILIFYIVNCELITQQVFQNVKGLQQLKLVTMLSQDLDQDYKYTLILQVINDDTPLLLICDTFPYFSETLDEVIQKHNCLTDKMNLHYQMLTLSNEETPTLLKDNYHIYQLSTLNPFIGAYSKNLASYQISLQQNPNQECTKQCLNDGKCLNGYCQCQIGFFYDDCSIQGILLNELQSLQPQTIYYIPTNYTNSFQILLSESVEYLQICIAANPNFQATITTFLNNINIPSSIFSDCQSQTDELAQTVHFQILGAIVIQILSDSAVFLTSPLSSSSNSNTIALSVSIPFCVIIIICVCCLCIIKRRKTKEVVKTKENNEIKTLIDVYMPPQQYNGQQNEKSCIICLEVFRNNTEVRITYCQHIYHSSCLIMWMKKHQNCPICRQSLEVKALEEIFTQGNAASKDITKPLKTILQSFEQTQKIQSQYPSNSQI